MRLLLLSSIFILMNTTLFLSHGLKYPVTVPTVSYVSKCPSNESEWETAAQQKQCNTLGKLQNCTECEQFVYHCVLNKDGTKYVEVCAPVWFMSGFCARFSVTDGRIINDPGLDCTKFSTPCPARFQSNESFKYPECYAILQQSTPSKYMKNEKDIAATESNHSALVAALCIFVITTVLLVIVLILILWNMEKVHEWWSIRSKRKGTAGKGEKYAEESTHEDEYLLDEEITTPKGSAHPTVENEEEPEEQNYNDENQAPRSISADIEAVKNTCSANQNELVLRDPSAEATAIDDNDDEKMSYRTLSGLEGLCSVKNVTTISDLRDKLAKKLSKKREHVWVVQEESGIIYNDDTKFTELKKHQRQIEVMIGKERRSVPREYRSNEHETDVISNNSGVSEKCWMTCNHLTEPENLFNYTKAKICTGSVEVECPNCKASWEMEELVIKADMSPEEQLFFGKAMSINVQSKKKYNISSR